MEAGVAVAGLAGAKVAQVDFEVFERRVEAEVWQRLGLDGDDRTVKDAGVETRGLRLGRVLFQVTREGGIIRGYFPKHVVRLDVYSSCLAQGCPQDGC